MNILKVICLLALALSLVEAGKSKRGRKMKGRARMDPVSRKSNLGEICYNGGPSAEFPVPDEWWACVAGTTCIKVLY